MLPTSHTVPPLGWGVMPHIVLQRRVDYSPLELCFNAVSSSLRISKHSSHVIDGPGPVEVLLLLTVATRLPDLQSVGLLVPQPT